MQCRFIDTGFNDCFTNMAIDEAILQYCSKPVLRVYQWFPKAVSIGYNQNIQKEINLEFCKKNNIDIVRRITGGKAIFHDNELTYSFVVPENAKLLPRDVTESYRIIAQALILGLERIGIKSEIKKQKEKISTPICFNSSNRYELTVSNKKISGSAQRRFDGKILQHGPILIDFDYEKNSLLFNSKNPIDNIYNLKKRITSMKNELSNQQINNIHNKSKKMNNDRNKNNFDEMIDSDSKSITNGLKEAIKHGFKKNFSFDIIDDSLSDEETLLAEKLKKNTKLGNGVIGC